MSLDPRNIVCDGPDVMSNLLAVGIFPLSSSGEGSPIYTTLDAEVIVNGTYSDGDLDYSFSGTTAIDQCTRISLRSIVGGVDFAGENYEIPRANDVSSWADLGYITGGGANEFVAVQANTLGCNGGNPPFAPPIFYPGELTGYVDGTRTDTAEDPDVEETRSIELIVGTPYFTGSIKDGDLEMVVYLTARVNVSEADEYSETFYHEIDASAWVTTDFRDIRGTYGTISYDVNGIEYVWSVTIG